MKERWFGDFWIARKCTNEGWGEVEEVFGELLPGLMARFLPILERAFFPSKTIEQEKMRRKEWEKEKA